MTLKSKLLLGFFAVLVLTGFVGFWGYHGMEAVSLRNAQGDAVTFGAQNLLKAQAAQMEYFLTSRQENIAVTRTALTQSKTYFASALGLLAPDDPLRTSIMRLSEYADSMLKGIEELLQHTVALAKIDDDYTEQGKKLVATVNGIIDNGYALQNDELNLQNAKVVRLSTDARGQLFELRLTTWPLAVNPTQKNFDIVLKGVADLRDTLNTLEPELSLEASKALTRRGLDELQRYEEFVRQSGRMTMDRQQMVVASGQLAEKAVGDADQVAEAMGKTIATAQQRVAVELTVVVALAIILGVSLALWITRNVLRQLGRDPGVLADMAHRVSEGDYNIDDGQARRGVYADFVSMVKALCSHMDKARQESERAQKATGEAREAAQRAEEATLAAQRARSEGMLAAAARLDGVVTIVTAASNDLAGRIERSEHGAEAQAARMGETATAMEEMNSTVLEVARNASSTAEVSAATRQKAEAGARVVREAVESIQTVQSQSHKLKDDMRQLNEHAQAINQIMGVISDIADQTNLLALNAAIEAARAGEAGRGFAVVADEVRKLAEKTMASTTDVANAIRAIQQSAQASVTQVDVSVTTIAEATRLATQSGEALREIVELVDTTAEQVRAIATAAEEQSSSSEEINQSITEVNNIAGDTALVMAEASRAVGELSEQAHVLSRLIEEMKRG